MIMVHLAFVPKGEEANTKPIISSELYKVLQEGPNPGAKSTQWKTERFFGAGQS